MKNAYPPRLCEVRRYGLDVPEAATAKVRRLYAEMGPLKEPTQVAADIWMSGREIGGHRDSTAEGKVTYGVLLCADGYYPHLHYGIGNHQYEYAVVPGTIYVIDAREYHGLSYKVGSEGLVAFLAWDLPFDFTLQGFARRATRRLRSWAKLDTVAQPSPGRTQIGNNNVS